MGDSILSVTSAVAPSAALLASLADLKADLKITSMATDRQLTRHLTAASNAIQRYCGWPLIQQTYSEQWRLDTCRETLILSRYPISSIESVTVAGTVEIAALQECNKAAGLLYRLDGSDCRVDWGGKVVVVYKAGFKLTGATGTELALPADVQACALELARMFWFGKDGDPGLRSERLPDTYEVEYQLGGVGAGVEAALPQHMQARLAEFCLTKSMV